MGDWRRVEAEGLWREIARLWVEGERVGEGVWDGRHL